MKKNIIDKQGYRANVGIILCNVQGLLFWGRRHNYIEQGWQFPQGGIDTGETPEQAMYRELTEEVGLQPEDVRLLAQTQDWLTYDLPFAKQTAEGETYIGQKQQWFLLQLGVADTHIDIHHSDEPEFDRWCWVSASDALAQVVPFRHALYENVLAQFAPTIDEAKHA